MYNLWYTMYNSFSNKKKKKSAEKELKTDRDKLPMIPLRFLRRYTVSEAGSGGSRIFQRHSRVVLWGLEGFTSTLEDFKELHRCSRRCSRDVTGGSWWCTGVSRQSLKEVLRVSEVSFMSELWGFMGFQGVLGTFQGVSWVSIRFQARIEIP